LSDSREFPARALQSPDRSIWQIASGTALTYKVCNALPEFQTLMMDKKREADGQNVQKRFALQKC
jgi:hypothetical protein